MPKPVEAEDESEPDPYPLKIRALPFWRDLAVPILVISPDNLTAASMKRSFRPLFSVLLFAFFIATLICKAVIRRSSAIAELRTAGLLTPPPPVFNATLLEFSAIDPGEPKFKQEIDQLVDYEYTRRNYNRIFTGTSRRFNRRLPVMLRSPQFYRYWSDFRRNLQFLSRKKAYDPNIMFDLVRIVKNQIDTHNGLPNMNEKYSSCAVVGNSGILLNAQYGELIDSHEAVIRLNNARTERFEKNVGSKTTISFINSNILHLCARRQGCYCHPYGESVPVVMYICQPVHFLDYSVCKPSHKSPLIVTDPRFDVLCARIVKYYSVKRFVERTGKSFVEWSNAHDGSLFHYSSGMQAVMLALGVCNKVSVFGFGKTDNAKHHYHTNQKAELRLHDYEAEYDFYHDLVENQRAIPFFPDKIKIPPAVIYH